MQMSISTPQELDQAMCKAGYKSVFAHIPEEEWLQAGLLIYHHKTEQKAELIHIQPCCGWILIENRRSITNDRTN